MVRYSPKFGNKLQIMVEIGKEYGFTSNFEMPLPFTARETELPATTQNGEQPIRLQNGLLYPRVEVEQRTHSGDDINRLMRKVLFNTVALPSL